MRESLYVFAGGWDAILALAVAHHARCLADPELSHPFSHADLDPQHVEHLAAYWAEVLGGPPRYSESGSGQAALLEMHAEAGDMTEMGRRFVQCFVQAADDAGLPHDPRFRAALHAYMLWAVDDVLAHSDPDNPVPPNVAMPHWSWDGLETASS